MSQSYCTTNTHNRGNTTMKPNVIEELALRTNQSSKLINAYAANPDKQTGEMKSRATFLNSEIEKLSSNNGTSNSKNELNSFLKELDKQYPTESPRNSSRIAYYRRSSMELSDKLADENDTLKRSALISRISELESRLAKEEELESQIINDSTVNRFDGSMSGNYDYSGSGTIYRDAQSGQIYRALKHGERLSRSSGEQLSPGKYLRGCLLGNWNDADKELRAYGGNLGVSGGFLLPEELSTIFIDAARNKSRTVQAGAQTISIPNRSVTIAKVTKDASASYKQENEAATDDQMEFGYLTLESRTLVAYATLSQEILQDAMNLDQVVMNAFGEALALEIDKNSLFGSGVGGQPLGLYNYDGVGLVSPDANGFTLADYDEFSEAIQDIENANGEAKAVIYSPRTAAKLRELKEATTNAYLAAPSFFTDLRRLTTNQVPNDMSYGTSSDASAAFIGDFSQMLFAVRQDLRIETSNIAGEAWQRYQHKIRATLRYDIAVLRPSHFSIIKGIRA